MTFDEWYEGLPSMSVPEAAFAKLVWDAAQEIDGGWVSFSVAQPEGHAIVQQYLGEAVLEHSNPPEWAFPTERWRGKKDSAATHWRYVDAPNA